MPKPIFRTTARACTRTSRSGRAARTCSTARAATPTSREMCKHYIGGILKHAPALLAFIAPSTNCYRRLVPGYEAPINLAYSARNRSAAVRIPMYSSSREGEAARVPHARPDLQPVPVVRGLRDGRARRRAEQDRPRRAARQGHLRAARRGGGAGQAAAGLARRGARQPREGPRVPAEGRRLHARTSSRPGSSTSARTRSTRSACARTRTSSRCTSTFSRGGKGGRSAPLCSVQPV